MYLVYKHTSPSGKSYIGFTCDYERRSYEHRTRPECRIFARAIKKYGWDNFTHDILFETAIEAEALQYEIDAIAYHQSIWPTGYNISAGGGKGGMSAASIRRKSKTYRVTSPAGVTAVITNLQAFCREHDLTAQVMRGVATGRYNNHNGWICQYVDDNTVRTVKDTNSGHRKVWLLTEPDGTVHTVYNLVAFCKENNLPPRGFRQAYANKSTYKGWSVSR